MNFAQIAIRSIRHRWVASLLTGISMALGVMMVVSVLSIHGVVSQSFINNSTLGYNIIIGAAKGGKLQLTLNTVFYLSQPNENLPYTYYMEFQSEEDRIEAAKYSIETHAQDLEWALAETQSLVAAAAMPPGGNLIGSLLGGIAMEETQPEPIPEEGRFSQFSELVIPVCLGDYFGIYRVVGTTPDMFNRLTYGEQSDKKYKFSAGRNFQTQSEKYGFFEAVVGSKVAKAMKVKVGDPIAPTHGDPEGEGHGRKFYCVGILAPTGTPNDRAVFVNIHGFYLMEGHAKPLPKDEDDEDEDDSQTPDTSKADVEPGANDEHLQDLEQLPLEAREVTAMLLLADPIVATQIPNLINEGDEAQAVLPIAQIFGLFEKIVGPIQKVLVGLTALICLVSSISILVSIYNSMTDRRQEIAVMRALGAGRTTVMMIILLEAIFLSLGGATVGWLAAHSLNAGCSGWIESETGVTVGFFDMVTAELFLIPSLVVLAIIVGILPAIVAYRTDVAGSLGE